MNEKANTPKVNTLAVAKRIDQIAAGAMELFKAAGGFESELAVAQAVSDLRAALSPEVMQPIMALMNTDLGFRTDRDPKVTPKDKDGNIMTPYSVEIVRECFIESKLRGFHAVGNEWNIIAGRFYACRNGLKRKCEQWAAAAYWREQIQLHPYYNPSVECFVVLLVNARRRLVGHHLVAIGTLNSVAVHAREVFRAAIARETHGLILMHNHPSGDPTPSDADIKITRDLIRGGHSRRQPQPSPT